MPLLRLAKRIARAEKVTHADIFAVHSERLIAQGPLVLCILSLLAIYLKPTQPARYVPITLLLVVAYSAFAIALVALTSHTFLSSTKKQLSVVEALSGWLKVSTFSKGAQLAIEFPVS
jgi:hypothetical protein